MLTLVVGTNRPDSNTRKVALEVRRLYAELGVEIAWVDLAELPSGIFASNSYGEGRLTRSDLVERLRAQAAGFISFVKQLEPRTS